MLYLIFRVCEAPDSENLSGGSWYLSFLLCSKLARYCFSYSNSAKRPASSASYCALVRYGKLPSLPQTLELFIFIIDVLWSLMLLKCLESLQ